MKTTPPIGVQTPKILLPKPGSDLSKWAVIACDQFTSEPEYWQEVAALVGDAPSTYHMILPEVYLDTPEEDRRLQSIRHNAGLPGPRRLRRTRRDRPGGANRGGKTRHGIMLALDLEQYDYSKGSASLIRATEGTILERIPPRVRIRVGRAAGTAAHPGADRRPGAHRHRAVGGRPPGPAEAVRLRSDAGQRPSQRVPG